MTDFFKTLITVPTYWTYEERKKGHENIIYDHPTPLNQDGTLSRLLESLKKIKEPKFSVLIITATADPKLVESAEAKVSKIIKHFKSTFPITQFSINDLKFLREQIEKLEFKKDMVSLQGYGNVRNIQLIAAQVLGSKIVIGLDDDEIVTDGEYLKKIWEYIGREHSGKFVGGIAGFYLNSEGSNKTAKGKPKGENIFDHKLNIMDDAIKAVEEKSHRLVETNFVYGGNMVIHRQVFQNVPFDPYIPRGEDIDYLINARMVGYHFFLDKELFIVHLPPVADSHLQEDVKRFIYEKAKLAMAKKIPGLNAVEAKSLEPYPGFFLHENLEIQILEAIYNHNLPRETLEEAKDYTQEMLPRYFDFQKEWPHLMEALRDDVILKEWLKHKMEVL